MDVKVPFGSALTQTGIYQINSHVSFLSPRQRVTCSSESHLRELDVQVVCQTEHSKKKELDTSCRPDINMNSFPVYQTACV